jgi:hypothetical protein
MVELARTHSERRRHGRRPGKGLVAEIRGKQYDVLDISFGGIKVNGRFTVAGGLVNLVIVPTLGKLLIAEAKAEVRGRVERVDGDLTAVRFSILTDALAKLIAQREADKLGVSLE